MTSLPLGDYRLFHWRGLETTQRTHGSTKRLRTMADEAEFRRMCYASVLCIALFSSDMPANGDPNGIRTRVTAVKGRCPGPLDDRVTKAGQYQNCCSLTQGKSPNCFQSFLFETAHPLTARRSGLRRDK